jgi:DNA-binding CsgD family transcriptional regulator
MPDRRVPKNPEIKTDPSLPLGAARSRQMPAIVLLDTHDTVVLANDRALRLLRDMVVVRDGRTDGDPALPSVLQALLPELRSRVRDRLDTSTVALLTVDLCVRACHVDGGSGRHLLLVFERVERKDAVQHNLERYALTRREREVVMLLLHGHPNRRIADQLFLTEYTVEDHMKRIFTKLGVRSRTALASKILGWREG